VNVIEVGNRAKPARDEIRRFGAVLSTRKWTIASVTLLVVAVAMALSFMQTRVYTATSTVLVETAADQSAAASVAQMSTEKQVGSSEAVAQIVAKDLNLDASLHELLAGLTIDVPVDTQILEFHYTDPSPAVAQARADGFANAYLDFRQRQLLDQLQAAVQPIQDRIGDLTSQLSDVQSQATKENDPARRAILTAQASSLVSQIGILEGKVAEQSDQNILPGRLLEHATLPTSPSKPNHKVNLALGIFAGLSLGVLAAILRERADDRVRERVDLETEINAPVLSVVPAVKGLKGPASNDLVTVHQRDSIAVESFRQLRANMMFASSRSGWKSFLITSCGEGEGKTFTAANLGVALARAGKKVILLSADLRKPRLDDVFQVVGSAGMTDILGDEAKIEDTIRHTVVANLSIVPSGTTSMDPAELLASGEAGKLIADLEQLADFVIIDAAPLLAVADAAVLAQVSDAVLFVADAKSATGARLVEARQQLDRTGTKLVGAVLLNARIGPMYGYPYRGAA
jgi:capsular exopolysaccharide synthesis family protein